MSQFLRRAEVCALLAVSRTTLWRMIERGAFPPPVNLTGTDGPYRWRLADVQAFIDGLEARRTTDKAEKNGGEAKP